MAVATTEGIEVRVEPHFHRERSDPARSRWFFSYTVTVTNQSDREVTLRSRYWVITNARGHEQIVRGVGVVGEQPVLGPGERFEYTSYCPLDTSLGGMHGSYTLEADDGTTMEALIPAFALADPDDVH